MPHLNYHHLRYFWIVATEGSMSRAAERLNVSPSSLSVQIKSLEEQLGQQLFERRGKSLILTEAGRIALDYASTVFRSGHELIEALSLAVREKLTVDQLAESFTVYPSLTGSIAEAARRLHNRSLGESAPY